VKKHIRNSTAELFDVTVPTVNEHLKNIYAEQEISRDATIRKFRTVQAEAPVRKVQYIKRNLPRHARRVLLGIHFSHGFPIKPSEMTVSRMRRKTEHFLGGVA